VKVGRRKARLGPRSIRITGRAIVESDLYRDDK